MRLNRKLSDLDELTLERITFNTNATIMMVLTVKEDMISVDGVEDITPANLLIYDNQYLYKDKNIQGWFVGEKMYFNNNQIVFYEKYDTLAIALKKIIEQTNQNE